jgi:hypothetical protein
VIGGPHRRFSGLAFGVGVVLGQAAACGLAFALGVATIPQHDGTHETLRSALELGLGVAMLAAAARIRYHPRPAQPSRTAERSRAVLARLAQLSAPKLLLAGAALGIGGPKRLGITALVAATISASGWSDQVRLTFALAYVVIATVLVWVPVLLALVFGHETAQRMQDVQAWLVAHRRALTFFPLTVLGILVIVDAAVALIER